MGGEDESEDNNWLRVENDCYAPRYFWHIAESIWGVGDTSMHVNPYVTKGNISALKD